VSHDPDSRTWDTRRADKARRLARTAPLASGKVIPTEKATAALEALLEPGDKVILEGDNQKQADFLSRSLAAVDPGRVHDLHLLISTFSRPEQLDLFEDGIASGTDFAYAGAQSTRVAQLLADGKMEVGAIHTYVELYGRLFVDLIPKVALIAANAADRDGNLYTGPNTEDTDRHRAGQRTGRRG
jgi:malonate decarboxylase alpha subunit